MLELETCFDYSFIEMDETDFFVIGRCTSGSRHYSEYLSSLGKAFEMFDVYADLVDYFGGGTVELWATDYRRHMQIKHKHV